jgi:DNA-binding transcriptional ArsR family regulator
MKPRPIETVVIRPIRLALPAPGDAQAVFTGPAEPIGAGAAAASGPADYSPRQAREQETILELCKCPVRQRILLALASGGRAYVDALARRMRVDQKTLSHHLGYLRTADLVFFEQRGKRRWYESAPDRVRYERQGSDRFSLLVTGRSGTVALALMVDSGAGFMNAAPGSR